MRRAPPEKQHRELKAILQAHLGVHGARADFMARFVLALISQLTLCLAHLARTLKAEVASKTNEQRISRFLSFELDQKVIARLVLGLIPQQQWVISIDRTEHRFGKKSVNLLVLAVCWQGMAIPLLWVNLDKKGCSNADERIALINDLLDLLPANHIACIVADREFACERWLEHLKLCRLPFALRCKYDALVEYRGFTRGAGWFLRHAGLRQVVHHTKVQVYNNSFNLVALNLDLKGEMLILLTNLLPNLALEYYKQRWQIETLFSAFKTRGFNFEDTHLTQPERIERLVGLMVITMLWVRLVGQWLAEIHPIPLKKLKGRPPQPLYTLFAYGLQSLQPLIRFGYSKFLDWHSAISLL